MIGARREGANYFHEHVLLRLGTNDFKVIDKSMPAAIANGRRKPVTAKITVTEKEVTFTYDGKKVFEHKKPDDVLGQFAIACSDKQDPAKKSGDDFFQQLLVDGTIEPSWIEGLVDASLADEWDSFDASYVDPPEFDPWGGRMVAEKSTTDLNELAARLPTPDRLNAEQARLLTQLTKLSGPTASEDLRSALEGLDDDRMPRATRELGVRRIVSGTPFLGSAERNG